MKKLTFICSTAPGVGHTGGINVLAVVHSTHSAVVLLTEDHLYQAVQTKTGVKAAVAVLSLIILFTVRYMKIQNTGWLQLDNPDVVFSLPNFQNTCLIIATSKKTDTSAMESTRAMGV